MSMMHTETYNAFIAANVPTEEAQKAAIAIASDQNSIINKLTQMGEQNRDKLNQMGEQNRDIIIETFNHMREESRKDIQGLKEDIHALDKKFLIITTVMSTSLPIIGGMLVFVLRAIN